MKITFDTSDIEDVARVRLLLNVLESLSGATQTSLERDADRIWKQNLGEKIKAIKELRSLHDLHLKEAKDLIDAASQRNPA